MRPSLITPAVLAVLAVLASLAADVQTYWP